MTTITKPSEQAVVNQLFLALHFEKCLTRTQKSEIIKAMVEHTEDFSTVKNALNRITKAGWVKAEEELGLAQSHNVQVVSVLDPLYPKNLRAIPDPPALLFLRGKLSNITDTNILRLAIVGMRDASCEGRRFAQDLAMLLSEAGACIVSGLALGVDSSAHQGALCASKKSNSGAYSAGIAVLGSGLCNIYPSRNIELADELVANGGAIISEYSLFTSPRAFYFPERNRIVSGLAAGTIVIEARKRSGSLITARLAAEQGREVFAVPGSTASIHSSGTNELIKDGAHMLTSVDDVFAVFPQLKTRRQVTKVVELRSSSSTSSDPETQLDSLAQQIIGQLKTSDNVSIDSLQETLDQPIEILTRALTKLELSGHIQRHIQNTVSLRRTE